jgi:hypothetical protein
MSDRDVRCAKQVRRAKRVARLAPTIISARRVSIEESSKVSSLGFGDFTFNRLNSSAIL